MPEQPPIISAPEEPEKLPGWMTLEELNVEIEKLKREIAILEKRVSGDPHARPDASGFTPGKVVENQLSKKLDRLAGCIMSRDALLGTATGE